MKIKLALKLKEHPNQNFNLNIFAGILYAAYKWWKICFWIFW